MPGTGLVEVKIGVVGNFNHDHSHKIADGILASVTAAVHAKEAKLAKHGLRVTVLHKTDLGSEKFACEAVAALRDEGCIAIIGPCDSVLMAAVLAKAELADIPKISTLATATRLAEIGSERGFFRFTPNDTIRAEHLIRRAGDVLGRHVLVYELAATENAYATELAASVHEALERDGRQYMRVPFQKRRAIDKPPAEASSAIICAPSVLAFEVISQLRGYSFSEPIFAFGSNSAFRKPAALGTIVVADLDRTDWDASIKAALAGIESSVSEPSLSTFDAMEVLYRILVSQPSEQWSEPQAGRRRLLELLSGRLGVRGLFGPVWLDERHDRDGPVGLYLLQVATVNGRIEFSPWSPGAWEHPHFLVPRSDTKRVVFFACIVLALFPLCYLLLPFFGGKGINALGVWSALVGALAFIVGAWASRTKR